MKLFSTSGRCGAALLAAGAIAAGSVGIAAGTASASTAKSTEYFVIGGSENHEQFVAHGAIVGGGRDDASNDNYDVIHFAHGTLRLSHPDGAAKFTSHLDARTCYGTFTLTGAYTIGHGTGRYRHVTGHGRYKGVGYVIAPRTKAGTCNENAAPQAEVFTIQGHGPIALH